MKCPYRKRTTNILNEIFEFYMDCYKEECPFWGAIGMAYNVDDGLYHETETGCRRAKKEWNPQ